MTRAFIIAVTLLGALDVVLALRLLLSGRGGPRDAMACITSALFAFVGAGLLQGWLS